MMSFIFTKCSFYVTWVPADTQETPFVFKTLLISDFYFIFFTQRPTVARPSITPILCDVDTNPLE